MATVGRPRQGATPKHTKWQIQATVSVAQEAVTRAVQRNALYYEASSVIVVII